MTTHVYRDADEAVVTNIIVALLDMLHSDRSGDQGGPNWAARANGKRPQGRPRPRGDLRGVAREVGKDSPKARTLLSDLRAGDLAMSKWRRLQRSGGEALQ